MSKKVEEIMSKNKANLTQEEKAAKAKVEAANVEEKKIISNFEALKSYYKKKLDEKKMNITDEKKVDKLPEYHKNKAVNKIINYYMKPKKLVKFSNDVYKEIHEFKKYNEDKERYNDIEKKDYDNLLKKILLDYPYLTMIEIKNLSEEDIKNIFNL